MRRLRLVAFLLLSCIVLGAANSVFREAPYLYVLGIAQDAGFPQANCERNCCKDAFTSTEIPQRVASIAVVDPASDQFWMIDATPDFTKQLRSAQQTTETPGKLPEAIFLTHAHIGHYTGLMYLGREAMGANRVPVYAMPKMKAFLENNGPWSQLLKLGNIQLLELKANQPVMLNDRLRITPVLVPHRDEFSETVGFEIQHGERSALYIPDIDKWDRWEKDILEEVGRHDLALLDGTFYANGEIPGRDMSEIPHPFIEESMALFDPLSETDRDKVRFIHFNHTNPVMQPGSEAAREVEKRGYHITRAGDGYPL